MSANDIQHKQNKHECPYDGLRSYYNRNWLCGSRGHLCHRCREDREDARAKKISAALMQVAAAPLRAKTMSHKEMMRIASLAGWPNND